MRKKLKEVPVDQLRHSIDPETLEFSSTNEIPPLKNGVIGQERAVNALTFGIHMSDLDYNIYVAGPAGTGAGYIVKSLLEDVAGKEYVPPDWCYVHSFKEPDKPTGIELPVGRGKEFQKDMEELIENLKLQVPEVFESESYLARKEEIVKRYNNKRTQIFEELERGARNEGFSLTVDQGGMMVIPVKEDSTPLTQDDIRMLSDEERSALRSKSEALQKEMNIAVHHIQQMEKEFRAELKALDRDITLGAVGHFIEDLIEKYKSHPAVVEYLKEVQDDVIKSIDDFKQKPAPAGPFPVMTQAPSFTRYEVNVFIDNSGLKGAPVIDCTNPTYPNLFGTMEYKAQFGALLTDFTMIKPGALHYANGGYLVIRILDLLKWYFSYEALKRSIKNREIRIEGLAEQFGYITTKTLKPEPIPLRAKTILIGDPYIYYLLYYYDEDFRQLFKIKAHLDTEMDRKSDSLQQLVSCVKTMVDKEGLKPLDKTGVARLIEHSMELAGDKEKLSLRITQLNDTLKESSFWATRDKSEYITADHIEKAINERINRANLYEEKMQEAITRGTIKIKVDGSVIGQVNGLSIFDLGDYMFGRPTRITANVSIGKEGVVTIDREAELSGKIHTKGVMILSGYLKEKFAQDKPLTLSATLAFEQTYGVVDGDSASGAELFALLSSLAAAPITQGIACTGAVSQKGEILPIGGATRKIEGFYETCKGLGLGRKQGVIIPESNVKDLMLNREIVQAVKDGKFHIYPVSTVEEAIEILTGMPAGKQKEDGTYEEDTIFFRADRRLREMA
ncbi:MAG: ATP-binding protein [Pseudomonadota bacterium]